MNDDIERLARMSRERGLHVAVAESLTSGALASTLGAGLEAATWFRGGIVAYDESVKFRLLGVTPGPVVTERCARQMAHGATRLFEADLAIGVTGVGGPEPSEGKPAGTVIMAVTGQGVELCRSFRFPGDADEVLTAAVEHAVTMLTDGLRHAGAGVET